ncbi:hypothetical protein C4569_02715 [Candidatus Parcubacteria bacterium]|nr:MAG: hypothetical protein C4569_02715 [Candidatus Parcubacteria bacterium]
MKSLLLVFILCFPYNAGVKSADSNFNQKENIAYPAGMYLFDFNLFGPITDLDRDDTPVTRDCDDTNDRIGPFRMEVPGNHTDENCDGILACPPDDFNDTASFLKCLYQSLDELVDSGKICQDESDQILLDALTAEKK